MAGISRVSTGSSNNPDIVRYTPFLPLMRRTSSLRISWVQQGVQGAKPPAGARGVPAFSFSPSGPQARQMKYESISGTCLDI